ncbi:MAG: hypothetical protein FWF88_01630 [Peptococcaceae bacterium]|nr:hypothetical protein [Peptococcaceae bacterium]
MGNEKRFCVFCGKGIRVEAIFCNHCGQKQPEQPPAAGAETWATPPVAKVETRSFEPAVQTPQPLFAVEIPPTATATATTANPSQAVPITGGYPTAPMADPRQILPEMGSFPPITAPAPNSSMGITQKLKSHPILTGSVATAAFLVIIGTILLFATVLNRPMYKELSNFTGFNAPDEVWEPEKFEQVVGLLPSRITGYLQEDGTWTYKSAGSRTYAANALLYALQSDNFPTENRMSTINGLLTGQTGKPKQLVFDFSAQYLREDLHEASASTIYKYLHFLNVFDESSEGYESLLKQVFDTLYQEPGALEQQSGLSEVLSHVKLNEQSPTLVKYYTSEEMTDKAKALFQNHLPGLQAYYLPESTQTWTADDIEEAMKLTGFLNPEANGKKVIMTTEYPGNHKKGGGTSSRIFSGSTASSVTDPRFASWYLVQSVDYTYYDTYYWQINGKKAGDAYSCTLTFELIDLKTGLSVDVMTLKENPPATRQTAYHEEPIDVYAEASDFSSVAKWLDEYCK